MHYKCRNNQSLKRDKVIHMVASLVTDDGAYPHVVNLRSPQLVVCIEIVKVLILIKMCINCSLIFLPDV